MWPEDTEQGASGDELALPDGTTVRDGDAFVGTGRLVPTRELAGYGEDGYWDHAVGFCTPEASEVLVLDRVRPAHDAEERALVRRAVRRLERSGSHGTARVPVVLSTQAVSVQVFQDLAADVVLRRLSGG